jgi:hypothetical protein
MRITSRRALPYAAVCIASIAATAIALRASAAGIPDADVLTYTGYLEGADGVPLTDTHSISVRFWASATGGKALCTGELASVALISGRFQVPLPEDCVEAVKGNPSLFVDVQVDGSSLGRSKLGAVPYSLESGRASLAAGALEERLAAIEAQLAPRSSSGAHMSAVQSIPTNTPTVIKFDTEDWDDATEYDPTKGTFTAKLAGRYSATCHVRYETGSPGTVSWFSANIAVNAANVASDGLWSDGFTASRNVSSVLALKAGDKVTCQAYHERGAAVNIVASQAGFEIAHVGLAD